jgi:hypothetical protein
MPVRQTGAPHRLGVKRPARPLDELVELMCVEHRVHAPQGEMERTRHESLARATDRRRRAQAKLDRGYDDYIEGRISEEFLGAKVPGVGVRGERGRGRSEPTLGRVVHVRRDG